MSDMSMHLRPLGWSPLCADCYVYYAKSANRWLTFTFTFMGFAGSKIFVEFIGIGSSIFFNFDLMFSQIIGIGAGLAANPTWAEGFANDGVGGLIFATYAPLGAFGKVCAAIM